MPAPILGKSDRPSANRAPAVFDKLRDYYRFHARIYEATRWAFLFGRKEAVELLGLLAGNRTHLLEVGCGTGHNLTTVHDRFPEMTLTGIDVSPEMLAVARRRLFSFSKKARLLQMPYGLEPLPPDIEKPQIILISYCLTMANPGWEAIIRQAAADLPPRGRIAVVDFHRSGAGWFRRWMGINHVRMDGQLLPVLGEVFDTAFLQKRKAYLGLWEYFIFLGEKAV